MSFYITLPCTASKNQFPENKIGKYTTLLAHELELNDNYEIGLCDVIIPEPRFVLESDAVIQLGLIGRSVIETITVTRDSISRFSDLEKFSNEIIRISCRDKKVVVHVAQGTEAVFPNKWFSTLLGLPTKIEGQGQNGTTVTGVTRGMPELAYVYVDICANTFIGDAMVPCLRAVPLEPHKATVIRFENVHYNSLQNLRFSTVSVDISDDTGKTIEFTEGLALVKIHFRIKK